MKRDVKIILAIVLPMILVPAFVLGGIARYQPPRVDSAYNNSQPIEITAPNLNATQIETFVNIERQRVGLPVLNHSDELTNSACAKLHDMMTRLYWDHNDPDGKTPWHFFDAAGYNYTKSGENLAYGFESDSAVVTGWMNSDGHRNNLLDNVYTEQGICTAVGPYVDGRTNITVQHLGAR